MLLFFEELCALVNNFNINTLLLFLTRGVVIETGSLFLAESDSFADIIPVQGLPSPSLLRGDVNTESMATAAGKRVVLYCCEHLQPLSTLA